MLANSSKSARRPGLHRVGDSIIRLGQIVGYSTWTVFAIFGIGVFLVTWIPRISTSLVGDAIDWANPAIQMIASLLVYISGIFVLLVEPTLIRRMTKTQVLRLLGIAKKIKRRDVGYALIAWGAYMVLTIFVQVLASNLLPMIDFEQKQDIGFSAVTGSLQILVTFFAIVIAVPFLEELVFRGYLYGSLRPKTSWWLASIIVGAIFGTVHGQWNVAFDTFVMSMVACYLREKTDSIWAGVLVHAFKNGLAFSLLFLIPDFLRNLLLAN